MHLVPKLPPVVGLVTMHFSDPIESIKATLVALKHKPTACELIGEFHIRQVLANKRSTPTTSSRSTAAGSGASHEVVLVVEFAAGLRGKGQKLEHRDGAGGEASRHGLYLAAVVRRGWRGRSGRCAVRWAAFKARHRAISSRST
ncbi:MAG: hypothetical protein IPO75_05905 [Betaproteobacteria bacterium]|nr:hypothetical protein [Betaproteobacteria bacterium]